MLLQTKFALQFHSQTQFGNESWLENLINYQYITFDKIVSKIKFYINIKS